MKRPTRFDTNNQTAGVNNRFEASLVPARPDPPVPFDGLTIGLATMSENSPHDGEMHPDGDEVLVLVSGRVRVVFEDAEFPDEEMRAGDGLIVPRGVWHRVDILEPSQILYATPGPGGEYRPLP